MSVMSGLVVSAGRAGAGIRIVDVGAGVSPERGGTTARRPARARRWRIPPRGVNVTAVLAAVKIWSVPLIGCTQGLGGSYGLVPMVIVKRLACRPGRPTR